MENKMPLVTVCVITYNSAEYILETLESIKAQTYKNIELVISDDKSSDETVKISQSWVDANKERFTRCIIVVPETNTGTSGNYNRGVYNSQGEWIKFIDGDDLLAPNCIDDNMEFVASHTESKVVFSNVKTFAKLNDASTHALFFDTDSKRFFDLDAEGQLNELLVHNNMPSASFFVNRQLISENPFDERFRLLEDAPKWIDLTNKGYKLYYFDKVTALYRRDESVMYSHSRFYSQILLQDLKKYFWYVRYDLIKQNQNQKAYEYQQRIILLYDIAIGILQNKRTYTTELIFKLIRKYIFTHVHYTL